MGERSAIEWTDATLFGSPLPKRCSKCREIRNADQFGRDSTRHEGIAFVCLDCRCVAVSAPGTRKRRQMRAEGLAWCRGCESWLPQDQVERVGACRACINAEDRARFAADETFRERVKARRDLRRRGVERMPTIARELIAELFDGECAYCDALATTWDHFVPVTLGGQTVPGNMVPACGRCNSRKKNSDPEAWLEIAPAVKPFTIEYLAAMGTL